MKRYFIELTEVEVDDDGGYIVKPILLNVSKIEYIKPSDGTDPMIGCSINTQDDWIEVKQTYKEVCDILSVLDLVFYFGHND